MVSTPGPLRPELIQLWRRQIGGRIRLGEERGPRPFVLISYHVRNPSAGSLVSLPQLTFYSLFDERDVDDRLATRLLGFRAVSAAGGIQIGGHGSGLMEKDLRLPPAASGGGRRIDATDADFLATVLGWERLVERCSRHPHYPRRATLRFPAWWCEPAAGTRNLATRTFQGRHLVELHSAVQLGIRVKEVFADLNHVPKRQVVACPNPRHVLSGTSGVTTFDLYTSRFRRAL